MNKKLFLIPVVIGLVVLLAIKICKKDAEHGNLARMEVPSTDPRDATAPKAVTVILDNSGSMQGYVNFASRAEGFAEAKQTMITNVADFMGNVDSRLNIESMAECGNKTYTSDKLIAAMRNYSAFSGAVTELDKLVEKGIQIAATDTNVAVIVSDMVLSYGKQAVVKSGNKSLNRQELPALSSLVGNQFKKVKDKDIDVLILKYESDFNGNFYCNCTENLEPSEFKTKLMKKRPYYFFLIGKEDHLKALCAKNCFAEPIEVFSTLDIDDEDMTTQPFTVSTTNNSKTWVVGEPNAPEGTSPICMWTDTDLDNATSTFDFTFQPIVLPLYARGKVVADFERDVIADVTFDSANLSRLTVTLKPFNQLPKFDDDVEIKLEVVRGDTAKDSSVDVDFGVSAEEMEGRTWGFESIIKKIYEAYDTDDDMTVAELKFAVMRP